MIIAAFPIIQDLSIIFFASILLLGIASLFRIPPILAYLVAGLLIGPYGLKLIAEIDHIEVMAEIGIVLLLFTIGMEFSIDKLKKLGRQLAVNGSLQVGGTIIVIALLCKMIFQFSWNLSFFIGFFISLSSTAMVLKILINRGQLATVTGQTSFSILIFQDIAIVPLMLLTPILAGTGGDSVWVSLSEMMGKSILILGFVFILARYIAEPALTFIAKSRNKEFFLVFVIGICTIIAYLTNILGLSIGLGAFLAGLVIANSKFSYQAIAGVLPFRELFIIFFFVSIGMLLNTGFILNQPFTIIGLTLAVLIIKILLISLVARVSGISWKNSFASGFLIAQIGEFSIILAQTGISTSLLSDDLYQLLLSVSLISIALTPLLFILHDAILAKKSSISGIEDQPYVKEEATIIIIGYGVIGQTVANLARCLSISYKIIEMNPETVRIEKAKGTPIIYGDATNPDLLELVGIDKATYAIITIPDLLHVRFITDTLHQRFPNTYIIARTRYVSTEEQLLELGADQVISEEYETAIAIFEELMQQFDIPFQKQVSMVKEIRSGHNSDFRLGYALPNWSSLLSKSGSFIIDSIEILSGSALEHKTIRELSLPSNYGLSIVAHTNTKGEVLPTHPDSELKAGELIIVSGKPEGFMELVAKTQSLDSTS